ncbi:unnamed protein product, partial [Brassica oleracea]
FYNHEPLLLPHFSLLPLRDSSLSLRRFPPEIRRYLRRSPSSLTQIMSHDDQTRPRQRRGRGGTGSQ